MAGAEPKTAFAMNGLLDELEKACCRTSLDRRDRSPSRQRRGRQLPHLARMAYGRKSVLTETGKIELEVPRDRLSTYDPQLIAKYQQRFPGFDTQQHRGTSSGARGGR